MLDLRNSVGVEGAEEVCENRACSHSSRLLQIGNRSANDKYLGMYQAQATPLVRLHNDTQVCNNDGRSHHK